MEEEYKRGDRWEETLLKIPGLGGKANRRGRKGRVSKRPKALCMGDHEDGLLCPLNFFLIQMEGIWKNIQKVRDFPKPFLLSSGLKVDFFHICEDEKSRVLACEGRKFQSRAAVRVRLCPEWR